MSTTDVIVVLCNCPDEQVARQIAQALVEQRLAACVNIGAAVQSVYRWQGAVEQAVEVPLFVKTKLQHYTAVEQAICALHPYDVPEMIALPVVAGYAPYLKWVDDETTT